MSSPLWMSIEPVSSGILLLLTAPMGGTVLKARLPQHPAHPRALPMLLESLSAWYRLPLHAALDADAPDVRRYPEHWAQYLGDLPGLDVTVEWVARPARAAGRRDRFLDDMGRFDGGRRLIKFAATGQT